MLKHAVFIFLQFLILGTAAGQAPTPKADNLPSIVPPSPELASLALKADLSTGMFTGSAVMNVPLYEISAGSIKLPIALAYNNNGIKVNDIPSRAGLGWNLVAGGVISRTIHDLDDLGTGVIRLAEPAHFDGDGTVAGNNAALAYHFFANLDNYDTERDEYSFSVNGMSGKFYFDDAGNVKMEDHSDIGISGNGNTGFILTTGEGIKYYFDDKVELVRLSKMNNKHLSKDRKMGWFLRKITSPEGAQIDFTYNRINISVITGLNQTVSLRTTAVYNGNGGCNVCGEGNLDGIHENYAEYATMYLTSIKASNGEEIYFNYENRPQPESSGDNRLTYVRINNKTADGVNQMLKTYKFEYQDFFIPTDKNQRFYLTKLKTIARLELPMETTEYNFEYYDPSELPSQRSTGQDFFGYSNGVVTNIQFFPRIANPSDYIYGDYGADRNPNFNSAVKGSLKKVSFPTGGYKEFVYEPHIKTQSVTTTPPLPPSTIQLSVYCAGQNHRDLTNPERINYFTTTDDGLIRMKTNVQASSGGPFTVPPYWAPGAQPVYTVALVRLYEVSTGNLIWMYTPYDYEYLDRNINLSPNTQYKMETWARGAANGITVDIYFAPPGGGGPTTTYFNALGCGIRVKEIKAYDQITGITETKYFTYNSLVDKAAALGKPVTGLTDLPSGLPITPSSGIGTLVPTTVSFYPWGGTCHPLLNIVLEECTNLIQVSSSNISGGFSYGGSPMGYASVIESDDPNMVNGGIEHKFDYSSPGMVTNLMGQMPNASPSATTNSMIGKEIKTRIFKNNGTDFSLLKEDIMVYERDDQFSSVLRNIITRKRWDPETTTYIQGAQYDMHIMMAGYDLGAYSLYSNWFKLMSTITKTFDENGTNPQIQTTTYTYENPLHTKPKTVATFNSKEETVEKIYTYSGDINTPVPTAMQALHMNSVILKEVTKVANVTTSVIETDYKGFPQTAPVFYKPELVKIGKGVTTEVKLHYFQYDDRGNVKEVAKENGPHLSYLYNYRKSAPVAEIINATPEEVSYTSFEGDDTGGWNFDPTLIHSTGVTGLNAFSGSVTTDCAGNKPFIVTAWGKNGTGNLTLNGSTGTLVFTGVSWSLYRWNVNTAGLLVLSGNNIDEIRCYPADAQMKTYTYFPHIGVSSVCDANNRIIYYEYDNSNRLAYIKDEKQNILKKICYNYIGQPEDCSAGIVPTWTLTGIQRCKPCAENPAYITTGILQEELRDMNPLSSSYNVSIWQDIPGTSSGCVSPPDWQNTLTPLRCKDIALPDPGEVEQEQIDINPCSSTYGNFQWVSAGYNSNVCKPGSQSVRCFKVPGKRLIEGICVDGTKFYQSAVLNNGNWLCTFKYFWPYNDCYTDPVIYGEVLPSPPTISQTYICY